MLKKVPWDRALAFPITRGDLKSTRMIREKSTIRWKNVKGY